MTSLALYGEIRDAAGRHFGADAHDALSAFGLTDLLASEDPTERNAAFAVAEAQGRAGAVTDVVSRIALAGVELSEPAEFGLGLATRPAQAPMLMALLGSTQQGAVIVIDDNGSAVGHSRMQLTEQISSLDPAYLTVFSLEPATDGAVDVPNIQDATARARLACAAEILGACEAMLSEAVSYVATRRQFGAPLASFQAVAHSLAWAATEVHQLRALLRVCLSGDAVRAPDHVLAAATKSMAGSVSKRVSQTTLQVTGGMGFTWEYSHNARHRRVLALDAVAGSSDSLNLELGRRLRMQDGLKIQDLEAVSLPVLASSYGERQAFGDHA
jgi:hypothetical protein